MVGRRALVIAPAPLLCNCAIDYRIITRTDNRAREIHDSRLASCVYLCDDTCRWMLTTICLSRLPLLAYLCVLTVCVCLRIVEIATSLLYTPLASTAMNRIDTRKSMIIFCHYLSLANMIVDTMSTVQSTDLWKNIDQCRAKNIEVVAPAGVGICTIPFDNSGRKHLPSSIAASVRLCPRARPSSAPSNHRRNKQMPRQYSININC